MQDVYKNIEEYNTRKESEILAASMIWLMIWVVIKD